MQKLVLKLLRKGEQPTDQPVRKRLGTLGSCVGVVANALLAGLKLLAGVLTGSLAVTADAVNNLSDAASSMVSLVSMRLAQKPVDQEHPFGHGRVEYLGALAVGVLILVMGVELLISSVRSIITPTDVAVNILTGVILILSVLVKGGLFLFFRALGHLIDFPSLVAAGKDSLSDMLATTAVLGSMVVTAIWGVPVDGYMGVLVALLVFKAGFDVVHEMADTLMGGKRNPEMGRAIIEHMMRSEEILGTHDLLIHDYGPGRCIASVHAEVPADGDLVTLHEVIDRVEREIAESLGIPICIHMDPVVTGDAATDAARDHLAAALTAMGEGYMLHDLRMVPGENRINLVFDVVIPPGCQEMKKITAVLNEAAAALDPRYACVIHFDIDYYHE